MNRFPHSRVPMVAVVALSLACCAVAAAVDPAPPAPAAEEKITPERAKEIANAFLKARKTEWGEPVRVEAKESEHWVIYPTSENEIAMLHWRTVIVDAAGKARFLPRR